MPDIAIAFDGLKLRGDWSVAKGDIATGPALTSAVLVSLFTDRRAPDGTVPPGENPRGHWSDTYRKRQIGSLLWMLRRQKKSAVTNPPQAIKSACEDALQWLLDDKVAASVTVNAAWTAPTLIGVSIVIAKPDGTSAPFAFDWAWNGI